MAHSLTAVLIIVFAIPALVLSQLPNILNGNAQPGTELLKDTCTSGPLVLVNKNATPWKFFQVENTSRSSVYSIKLNQTVDTWDPPKNCVPKKPWEGSGSYRCGQTPRTVMIRLDGVLNTHAPTICNRTATGCNNISSWSISVEEDTKIGSIIVRNITLCDMDTFKSESPYLHIQSRYFETQQNGNTQQNSFSVKLMRSLDYETATHHTAKIYVWDSKHKSNYSINLIVNVEDVDDQGPSFTKTVYHCNVTEGKYQTATPTYCTVKAKDDDTEINATIEYELIPTNTGSTTFSISKNGEIQVNGELDRETQTTYTLSVKGFENGRPTDRFNFTTVVITVSDKDDNQPEFHEPTASISIMENTQDGVAVYQFIATDPDEGANAQFTYRLVDTSGAFRIGVDGKLIVNKSSVLDRETRNTPFSVKAFADPTGKKSDSNPNAIVTITLIDVNDNSPIYEKPTYSGKINKTQAIGTPILKVTANDADAGKNGDITYSIIIETDKTPFSITKSGEISLNKNISENFRYTYNFVVKAEDQAADPLQRRSSMVPVSVNVNDVNTHPPTVTIVSRRDISEAADIGTTVASVNVTDKDPSDVLTVQIVSGNNGGTFKITKQYLSLYEVQVNGALDRESIPKYTLNITCSDGTHTFSKEVVINILDENDNAPKFKGPYSFTTTENKGKAAAIGTVKATDGDTGKNANISYRIDPDSRCNANFTIDPTSGQIRKRNSLDREALGDGTSLHFLVHARDHGDLPLTGSTNVTVIIKDLNDNPPVFAVPNVTLTIKELKTSGVIHTAKATDIDIGANKIIKYAIKTVSPGSAAELFSISSNSGDVKIKKLIRFSDSNNGKIVITIEAKNPNKWSPSQTVTLHIQDINDHLPNFDRTSYSVSINETTEPGSGIIKVTAVDLDVSPLNNKITYWLGGDDHGVFRIDPESGNVFLVKDVDLDRPKPVTEHSITVFASDMLPFYNGSKHLNVSVPLTVHVTPVNEYVPKFEKDSYTCIVEEEYTGPMNCSLQAIDTDFGKDGAVTYIIINQTVSGTFTINNRTGDFSLSRKLDYERKHERKFSVTVAARDMGSPRLKSSTDVTIVVQNINDCEPHIRPGQVTTYPENVLVPAGQVFFELSASDCDGDELSYEIKPPSDIFQVHNDKTVILNHDVTRKYRGAFRFDYENTTEYKFNVVVSDSKHEASTSMTLRISSMNEFRPTFQHNYPSIIDENTVFTTLLQAEDKDKDSDHKDGNVWYDVDRAAMDNIPGTINITRDGHLTISNLDKESTSNFTFTVLAIDLGSPALTGMTTFEVVVNGTDDNPPYYLEAEKNISLSVLEGEISKNIFKSKALDADIGVGSAISYRLRQGDASLFSVSLDGQLSIKPLSVNYSGEIRIEAFNPTNKLHTAVQIVRIDVQDVNNHFPHFERPSYTTSIKETAEPGSSIITVIAKDLDILRVNNKITYWLVDDRDGVFRIDPESGEVFLVKNVDIDRPNPVTEYNVTVFASDMTPMYGNGKVMNVSVPLTVHIKPVNEYFPKFGKDVYTCAVDELYTGPMNCITQASDADFGQTGTITYRLVNQTVGDKLIMDNHTGEIKVIHPFYYSKDTHVVVNVSATDTGNLTSFALVKIDVRLVNKNPPVIVWDPNQHVYVIEAATLPKGTPIVKIPVTDDDGNDGTPLRYNLGKGTDKLFQVEDGLISLAKNYMFDYEDQQNYTLELIVRDDKHSPVSTNITLCVINVNEYAPVITTESLKVSENTISTEKISAYDHDHGDFGNYKFRLADEAMNDNVSISKDGKLTISKLDRELLGDDGYFIVPVEAIDGGNLTGMANIKINVIGINDIAPHYLSREKAVYLTVNERTMYADLFTSVAYDDDMGEGSTISYRLKKGNKSVFKVSTLGVLSIQSTSLFAVDGKVELEIEAYNPDDQKFNAVQKLSLTVKDINNNVPKFDKDSYTMIVSECEQPGYVITTVSATDGDLNIEYNTITYWIEDATAKTMFSVNPKTGEVLLIGQLNYEDLNKRTFKFEVFATDSLRGNSKGSNHTTFTNVTIHVTNCNDNKPKFTQAIYKCALPEELKGDFNCHVKASDSDNLADLVYSLSSNKYGFSMLTNGSIDVNSGLDYDHSGSEKQFIFTATVNDTKFTSSAIVLITLENINDSAPQFLQQEYVFTVPENIDLHNVGEVIATDADGNDVSYSGNGTCSELKVLVNGTIVLKQPMDYEKTRSCSLTVYANDSVNVTPVQVTVDVLDANDNAPTFDNSVYEHLVNETAQINTTLLQVAAHDDDRSLKNSAITYSIISGNVNDTFSIDSTSGQIYTNATLDASVKQSYSMVIEARDGGFPTLIGLTEVNTFVMDVNNNKPKFLYTPYTAEVRENDTAHALLKVFAEDYDPDAVLKFTVLRSKYSSYFSFSGTYLYVATLDAEIIREPNISISIEVSDGKFSDTSTVELTVIDINDNIPYFIDTPSKTNLTDTTSIGTELLTVKAKDEDVSNNALMYILSNSFGYFEIDRKSGEVTLKKTLDVKARQNFILNITVIDSGSPPKSANTYLSIKVVEKNKYTPTFINASDTNTFSIHFNEDKRGQFAIISAHDNDNGSAGLLTYSCRSLIGPWPDSFSFDNSTGKLSLVQAIDFETSSQHEFLFWIVARDKATFPKSSTATVTVHITDVDEAPTFLMMTGTIYKELNATKGSPITTVTVQDKDKAEHFRSFTFSLHPKGGYFKIEKQGKDKAIIKAAKPLSQAGTFNVTVKVTDGGGLTDSNELTIHVSNITGFPLSTNITEGIKPPFVLLNLYNSTTLPKGTFFSIVKSEDSDNFTIWKNGSFVANQRFDREMTPEFKLEIEGHQNLTGEVILTAQIQMHVTVLDINDSPPKFQQATYRFNISESAANGTNFGTVTALDADKSPSLLYSIIPSNAPFGIRKSTGELYLAEKVDYENQTTYELVVRCTDTNFYDNATVIISIDDENDNKPTFDSKRLLFRVEESHDVGPLQGCLVTATDPDTADKGQLKYRVVTGNSPFGIDVNGQLELTEKLDYENMSNTQINVTVEAIDTAKHTSDKLVTIEVLDSNDNSPSFTQPEYFFNVSEGTIVMGSIYGVQATDKDSENNSMLTFSLIGVNKTLFDISTHGSFGYIHILQKLDRESRSGEHDDQGSAIYTLTVEVTDHGEPPLTATAMVHITVEDINDCPPKFSDTNLTANVQEGTETGTKLMTVTTTDCDLLAKYNNVTYAFGAGSTDVFSITPYGDVSLSKPVSINKQKQYRIEIVASDGQNRAKASLTINILDANDNSPNFTETVYTFSVSENVKTSLVGIVHADDEDPGQNGNVSYTISSGNADGVFSISKVNSSGVINLISALDREKVDMYSLIITAEDNAKKNRRQGTCTVIVQVEDSNDNNPVFGSDNGYSGFVKEDATNETKIEINTAISATDTDRGVNGTAGIRYSLLGQNETQFCIDDTTGVVTVCGRLDHEKEQTCSLKVLATDSLGGAGSRNTSADLTITIVDVNDNAPVFKNTPYRFKISENASAGMAVGEVTVTDADVKGLQSVRLSITHGSHDNFYIEMKQTATQLVGTIYVSGVLDREERSKFDLSVAADDTINVTYTHVIIDINDVNDNAPIFSQSHIEVKVVEESEPGIIYVASALDKDEPNTNNSALVFSFDQQTQTDVGSSFYMATNGSLYTKHRLDREKNSSYLLAIIASDLGQPPKTTEMSVTVSVLDVNDHAPQFCSKPPCVIHSYVVEAQPVGSIIALPVATDPDNGVNGTIVYSILPSQASKYFKIDDQTGLISIKSPIVINTLIRENVVNETNNLTESVTMEVDVQANDKGPPPTGKNSTLKLQVKVEPINENAPDFQGPCDFHIAEEQPSGTFVGDCTAVIANETYSHMTYTLIAGFDSDRFQINERNGTIRTKSRLDREARSHYSLSVQVADGRTPERTAFAAVKITVTDINDNAPVFYQSPIELQIPENSNLTLNINASAVDPDEGDNGLLTYSIDNSYDGLFLLNASNGIVNVNGTFDYEQRTNYTFRVIAKDNGNDSHTSSVFVSIAVLDINDNAPEFVNVRQTYEVPENQTGKIFQISATDRDSGYNGKVTYRIQNTDEGPFSIGTFDGWVYVNGYLDYETKAVYHLVIETKDEGLEPLSAVVNVTIDVIDVYDYVPKFSKDIYEVTMNASAPVGTKIIDLKIDHTGITYSISGGSMVDTISSGSDSGLFSVDKATGTIKVKEPLGLHNKQDVVTVTAVDARGQKAECQVIIYINNHEVLFPVKSLEVTIPENFNGSTLLLDLNTTEERSGLHMLYSISAIQPSVTGVFRIVPETGAIYCDKALDREEHGEYNIYIEALVSSANRHKRAIDKSSTTVKLTVHVDDENDNSPTFHPGQQSLFGVPADAKANFLVAQLNAEDPDLGDNGRIYYSATGHTDVFGVDRDTGSVKTLVAIASRKEKNFTLTVTASDGSNVADPNSTLVMQILVVPRSDRLMLQVNMSLSKFRHKQGFFIGNMSRLLGVDVQLENTESHHEQTDTGTKIDLSKTDMYFHGVNKTTKEVVPFDIMMRLINKAQADLNALFGNQAMEVTSVKMEPYRDPSAITVPIIALFCVAAFIFVGSFIAIVMALYSWSRINKEKEMLEKRHQADVKMSDFEMDTLRSHASQNGGPMAEASAVNPVFQETEFTKRKKPKEKKVAYETQEVQMQFPDEPLRFSDEILNNNGTRSVADSALENTSLTSNEQLRSEASSRPPDTARGSTVGSNLHGFGLKDGPMMTSSPRISKDFDAEGNVVVVQQGKDGQPVIVSRLQERASAGPMVTTILDATGETDTDEGLDDQKNEVKAKPESKGNGKYDIYDTIGGLESGTTEDGKVVGKDIDLQAGEAGDEVVYSKPVKRPPNKTNDDSQVKDAEHEKLNKQDNEEVAFEDEQITSF